MADKSTKSGDEGKVIAIVAYITLIGWIVALIMNNDKKNDLASYHIRQSLLLMITGIVLMWIPIIGWILGIVLFVFWLMGLISAIKGEKKPIPLIGEPAQNWFKSL
ncbi:hypothetical protein JXB28_05780 [Candidatus Woesearchaeota archaeon]|nr:hypothetical protein [Candidatus Woesearchaeota archaeon]